jgi:CO/xanthine dehydrogenase FAD-binding subunit
MIPVLQGLDLAAPATLSDALRLLASDGTARPFAGGTDLMVLLDAGRYVSLWGLQELRGISDERGALKLGALTTFGEIRDSETISRSYPMLAAAALQIGGIATQNRATIGGNIANASPAADSPPALIAYDAVIELASETGRRRLPYREFHLGYKQMRLGPGEIIANVILPPREAGWRDGYRKVGTRRAQAISKVVMALAWRDLGTAGWQDVRVALGSVAATPIRAAATEAVLEGARPTPEAADRAAETLAGELEPIDDVRSTADYRRLVAARILHRLLRDAEGW